VGTSTSAEDEGLRRGAHRPTTWKRLCKQPGISYRIQRQQTEAASVDRRQIQPAGAEQNRNQSQSQSQKTENRNQKTEIRKQKTENRKQSQKAEPESRARKQSQKSEPEIRARKQIPIEEIMFASENKA
jgi:hypothetical protein